MDEDVREPINRTRWLACAVAALLAAGVVSAGAVNTADGDRVQRVVTAAGRTAVGVEEPTTVPPADSPRSPAVPTAPSPTTTAAPVATTTTTTPTTTTKAPVTTTTAAAGATPRTTVSAPKVVTVTAVNEYPSTVVLTVNGTAFELRPGQAGGPVVITRYPHGNDIIELVLAGHTTCGSGDADSYFPTAGSYLVTVVAGPGFCELRGNDAEHRLVNIPAPTLKVTRT